MGGCQEAGGRRLSEEGGAGGRLMGGDSRPDTRIVLEREALILEKESGAKSREGGASEIDQSHRQPLSVADGGTGQPPKVPFQRQLRTSNRL